MRSPVTADLEVVRTELAQIVGERRMSLRESDLDVYSRDMWPRLLLSVVWPGGRVMHYATMRPRCWDDFLVGNQPAQERGVSMEMHYDDGSPEWAELYERVQRGPVRDQRL